MKYFNEIEFVQANKFVLLLCVMACSVTGLFSIPYKLFLVMTPGTEFSTQQKF